MFRKHIKRVVNATLSALVLAGTILAGPGSGRAEEVPGVAECGTDPVCLTTRIAVTIDPDAFLGCRNAGEFTRTTIANQFQKNITNQIFVSLNNLKAKLGAGTTLFGVMGKFEFISVNVDRHFKQIKAVVKLSVTSTSGDVVFIEERRDFEIAVVVKKIGPNNGTFDDKKECICLVQPEDTADKADEDVRLTVTKMCTQASTPAAEFLAAGFAGTIFSQIGAGLENTNQLYSEISGSGKSNLAILLELNNANHEKLDQLIAETQALEEEKQARQELEDLDAMWKAEIEAMGLEAP